MLIAHLADLRHLANEVVRRCNKHGLSVRFDDVPTAYTNRHEVVFPHLIPPITVRQLKLLWTQVIHEPGHQLRAEALDLLEKAAIPQGNPLASLWNVVEDEHMEREVQAAWRGDRKGLIEGHSVLAEDIADSWRANKHRPTGEHSMKAMAAYIVAIRSRRDWDYAAEANEDLLRRSVPNEVIELADELISEGWANRIAQGGPPTVTKKLAEDLFERLYPGHKAEDQQGQQPGDGEEEGTEGEGEPGDEGEGDEEGGKGKGGKPEPKWEDDETNAEGEKILKVRWDDIVTSKHEQDTEGHPMEIDWTGKNVRQGRVEFWPENRINVHDYTNNAGVVPKHSYGGDHVADKQFANQVRRLIQAESRVHRVNELKSGKLDKRNMIRVLLPSRDGGDWNRRVFHDVEERRSLNTAVTVLVDWSGSMSGSKMVCACQAARRLLDTFDRALRVPCEVLAFTATGYAAELGIIKSFKERSVTSQDVARRFQTFEQHSCGNADGDSIMWAADRLLKRNEERKVLIVLSDGSPSAGAGDHDATLVAAIDEARRLGIEVHGIGIMAEAVKHFYGSDCQTIDKPDDLNRALLGTLEKVVRRGNS